MFLFKGMWLPDGEKHFPQWLEQHGEIVDGRCTYQIKKWRACLPWIKNWRVAVDVGGHVGFWSIQMALAFDAVHAFEPVSAFRECFAANVKDKNVTLHPEALGDATGWVRMAIDPTDSGGTHVERMAAMLDDDPAVAPIKPLDSFRFDDVDFIKIDCEGYEHHVIEGARDTLLRREPCVIVEQKQHKLGPNFGIKGTPAVDMLLKMGAKMRTEISGDYILSWD